MNARRPLMPIEPIMAVAPVSRQSEPLATARRSIPSRRRVTASRVNQIARSAKPRLGPQLFWTRNEVRGICKGIIKTAVFDP